VADPTPQTFSLAVAQAKTLVFTEAETPAASVSGWAVRFRLRGRAETVLIEKTLGGGVTCTDGTAGVWEVEITEDDTEGLAEGIYDWSFWRTDNGSESPKAYGTCEVYETAETG
jgi:hypothetical protein